MKVKAVVAKFTTSLDAGKVDLAGRKSLSGLVASQAASTSCWLPSGLRLPWRVLWRS